MKKHINKIIATLIIIGSMSTTIVGALSWGNYGVENFGGSRTAYTGAYDASYAYAKLGYNKSIKEASAGNPSMSAELQSSLWAQTDSIIGFGGTGHGYHEIHGGSKAYHNYSSN